jgi:hypothetical protein
MVPPRSQPVNQLALFRYHLLDVSLTSVRCLFIEAAFHQNSFSSKRLFIKMAFHQIPIGVAFHQTLSKVAHSSNK